VIRIGVLAVCFLAISAFAADMSMIGGPSEVRSTPKGDPANRWHAPGAPKVNPVSGDEANQALAAFRVFCASAPQAPSLQCATRLRHSP